MLLQNKLDEPVDSYWNGSHTWFSDLKDTQLEWRLHPVANFAMPDASRPEELYQLGVEKQIDITHYWEGLEIYTFGDTNLSVEDLVEYATEVLGYAPDASGLVNHEVIGDEFERKSGDISIVSLLLEQLKSSS